jgi:hypothetical protein
MDNVFQQISESIKNAYDKGVLGWMILLSIPIILCCVLYAVGIMAERLAEYMSDFIVTKSREKNN